MSDRDDQLRERPLRERVLSWEEFKAGWRLVRGHSQDNEGGAGVTTGLTYEKALAAARKVGNARADDAGAMALYCADILQFMVGAASPKLVWEGAQKAGMTHLELARLAQKNPAKVHDLMWT